MTGISDDTLEDWPDDIDGDKLIRTMLRLELRLGSDWLKKHWRIRTWWGRATMPFEFLFWALVLGFGTILIVNWLLIFHTGPRLLDSLWEELGRVVNHVKRVLPSRYNDDYVEE